jgi:hypothetical protein
VVIAQRDSVVKRLFCKEKMNSQLLQKMKEPMVTSDSCSIFEQGSFINQPVRKLIIQPESNVWLGKIGN